MDKLDKFLDVYYLPRLNQEEIDNLNRLITSSEIELVFKTLQSKYRTGWLHREILSNI